MRRLAPARPLLPSLVVLALLALGLPARAAAATLSLTPAIGPPTTKVLASGSGFGASEVVDVAFDGTIVSHARTDPAGSFSKTLRVPSSALPGDHVVAATGESSGLTASAAFLVRTDWAQFHFDVARTGQNPYENVLSTSTVGNLGVRWSYGAGQQLNGGTAVADGVVYFGDLETPTQGRYVGHVYAADAATGTPIWTRTVSGCGGSPAVVGGIVYTSTCLGDAVMALSATTGETIWTQYTIGSVFGSPAVANGTVYAGANGGLYAFDAAKGTLRWKAPSALGAGASPPAVSDGLVFVGGDDFHAYDALTGDLVWSMSVIGSAGGAAVANGVVYVGTNNTPPYHLYALDALTGTMLWSSTIDDALSGHGVGGTPTVANGTVYVGTIGAHVYAFNAASGRLKWTFEIEGGLFWASPIVANGVLFTGSAADTFHALDARTGAQLWSYPMGGGVNGPSAVSDGVVYLGSFDHNLYAFTLP